MSRRGNCHDNAVAESFFQLLKRERIKKKIYGTREEARSDIFDYIEMFYNSKRRHGSSDQMSPTEYENKCLNYPWRFNSTKTVTTTDGPMELRTPRDHDGSFEPQLVKKNQTRITGMDNQILALYARGMTTREITSVFKEMYDADVSPALISKVTDAVID